MKNKYIIALFIVGTVVTTFGALLKIIHFEFGPVTGNVILTIGMLLEVISGVLFILKLLGTKDNSFLNK